MRYQPDQSDLDRSIASLERLVAKQTADLATETNPVAIGNLQAMVATNTATLERYRAATPDQLCTHCWKSLAQYEGQCFNCYSR